MAFVLKDIFFGLFGPYENKVDINKDASNKGTLERYHEALADEYDTNLHSLIEEVVDNNLVWSTAFEKMIPYLEIRLGIQLFMGSAMSWRRLVIHHVIRWYAIKGTIRAYTIMFEMLGFTGVTITEDFQQYGLDSPVTFDDDKRRFDSGCNLCGSYTIELTGALTITPEIVAAVFSVIEFNEPIHAFLDSVTYNGSPLVQQIISIEVDEFGDLVYNNDYDPSLVLTLVDGDLVVSGSMASHYSLVDGDLIFTI